MPKIQVNGRTLSVDIADEIADYPWSHAKWSDTKLIASSPFRYDRSPSFFLNLDGELAGTWGDSGYYDPEFKSGGFVKLLCFLRDETYEETVDYLIEKYDYESNHEARLHIDFKKVSQGNTYTALPEEAYSDFPLDGVYLPSRGIHSSVIALQGVRDVGKAVAIPWRGVDGKLYNMKYRSKKGKVFWYAKDGAPVNRLVFGIDHVIKRGITNIVICEAEIDAMTWQSAGIYAVAVGGVSFNERQADMIIQSGVRSVILGGDNDKAGERFNQRVSELLSGKVRIKEIDYSTFRNKKDANDLGAGYLQNVRVYPKKIKLK